MRDAPLPAHIRAQSLGVHESTLYYKRKMPIKDAAVRREIERVLREHRSYGHKRIAQHLKMNKKRIRRVMKLFGIKPCRRRGKKYPRMKPQNEKYPNLLQLVTPTYEGCAWVADFTHLNYRGRDICVATTIDLFTRKVVGASVAAHHTSSLIIQAFANALLSNGRPAIFHSDNGSEYHSKSFRDLLTGLGVSISRSKKGCPWENGV